MKNWIRITAIDGVVTISATVDGVEITFVGASCPASVRPGSANLTSFSLAPEVGKPAVVGMRTRCSSPSGRAPTAFEGYMLMIGWDGDKAVCNLKEDFVPRSNCLATVNQEGMLTLISGENKFVFASMCSDRGTVNNHVTSGFHELKDSTLAFKFINGDITIDELTQETGPTKADLESVKIIELTERVQCLERDLEKTVNLLTQALSTIQNTQNILRARNIIGTRILGWKKKLEAALSA